MSGLPLGAPVQRRATHGPKTRDFDHIPRLREVLAHGGWPGAIYAQVCIHNLKAARERSERPAQLDELHGGSIYYTITGPRGTAQVALVGTGEVIPGANPEAGNRLFFTDGEIGQITGLPVQTPIWLRPQFEEDDDAEVPRAPRANGAGQGRQGDARVEARHAPQRQPKRSHRALEVASGGDRIVREPAPKALTPKQVAARKAASERMKAYHAARRGA